MPERAGASRAGRGRTARSVPARAAALALALLLAACASGPDGVRVAIDSTFHRGEATPATIEELLAAPGVPAGFAPLGGRTVTVSPGLDHWFLVELGDALAGAGPIEAPALRIDFTGLDAIEVFVARGDELLYRAEVGDEVPIPRWPVPARVPTIPLEADGARADRVLLRPAPTGQPFVLPLTLVDDDARRTDAEADQFWYGAFFGATLAFLAYTGCLWIATRTVGYLAFTVYLAAFATLILTTSGIGRLWVWPGVEGFTTRFSLAAVGVTVAAMTVFVDRFLDLGETAPRLHRALLALAALALMPLAALPFGGYIGAQVALHAISVLALVTLSTVSIARTVAGSRPARFLVAAYTVLFGAIVLTLLRYNGLLSPGPLDEHLLEVAILLEALVLAVGLADSIAAIRERQQAAEARERVARERYTERLIRAHESERRRFGAILHDDIGHAVAALRYGLADALSGDESAEPEARRAALARLHGDSGAIIDGLRRLAQESHPHLLDQLGLEGALRSLYAGALDPHGIEWEVRCPTGRLPRELEAHLYRIAQECLTNALKHAEPARVRVRIERDGDRIAFAYDDDGVGADPATLAAVDGANGGFGLVSIRERARLLGGRVEVDTAPEEGFELRVRGVRVAPEPAPHG